MAGVLLFRTAHPLKELKGKNTAGIGTKLFKIRFFAGRFCVRLSKKIRVLL